MSKMKSFLMRFALAAALTIGSAAGILALTGTEAQAAYTYISSVKQTAMTQNSITVSYTGSTASSYQIYYKLNDYSSQSDYVLAGTTTATSFTVSGLQPGSQYWIKVQDAANSSTSRTCYDAMTQVGDITGLNEERWYHFAKSATCSWNRQTAADEYEVVWKNNRGKTVQKGTSSSISSTIYNINNNVVYRIQVRACQEFNGQTYYSRWASTKVFDQVFLKKVTYRKGKITLTWNRQKGVAGYDVYMSTSEKFSQFKRVKRLKASRTSYTIRKFNGRKLKKKTYYVLLVSRVKNGNTISKSGHTYAWKAVKGRTTKSNKFVYTMD